MDEEKKTKIVLPEKIFMFFVCFFADVFEFAATLFEVIPFVGPLATFAKMFGNIMVWPIVQGWLVFRGGRGKWALARNLIFAAATVFEFVPLFNALPLRTVSLVIVFILISVENTRAGAALETALGALPPGRAAKVAERAATLVK